MAVSAPTFDGPTSGILQVAHRTANPHHVHQVREELVCHVVPQNIIKLSRRPNTDRKGGAKVPRDIADGKSVCYQIDPHRLAYVRCTSHDIEGKSKSLDRPQKLKPKSNLRRRTATCPRGNAQRNQQQRDVLNQDIVLGGMNPLLQLHNGQL